MFNWLADNVPAVSGIAVATLSFLTSLFNLRMEQSTEKKDMKKLKQYAEIYSVLPEESGAKRNIDSILKYLSEKVLEQEKRKVNVANVIAAILLALVGGGLSYLVASWAAKINGFFSIVLWILFAVIALFTILISITGWVSRYNQPSKE